MNKKAQGDKRNEEYVNNDDWKNWSVVGWPYDGDVDDPRYIEERASFFISNAPSHAPFNGWWIALPNKVESREGRHKRYQKNRPSKFGSPWT